MQKEKLVVFFIVKKTRSMKLVMFIWFYSLFWGFPVVLMVKNPPVNAVNIRHAGSNPGSGKIPWRRKWQHTPVFLPGESEQRRLVSYSP